MLKPLPLNRWNRATAAHLLNRAGFGGPPGAVAALASRSPAEAVAALMAQKESGRTPDQPWAKPDPNRAEFAARIRSAAGVERQALVAEQRRKALAETSEMQEWWLGRMASGPDFFGEKLTLFWHGHFATSIRKVREPYLMWRQNDLFRRLGTGGWRELLQAVVRDPAMLIWLDQAQSRKEHPNENFARELMELFTLGEGRYSERDVAEAARALTGESLNRETDAHVYRSALHDGGTKTVLGVTGPLKSDDIIDAILAKPEADRFITGKLWTFYAGAAPGEKLGDALAAEFRACGQRFQPFLRAVFESAEFYEPEVVGRQIKSPVQWLITACLQLERPLPPAPVPSFMLRTLGQELFAPPNVKGWDGGAAWINTNTLLARHNLALLLVEGETAFTAAGNRLGIGAAAQLWHDRPLTPPADPKPWFAEADRGGRNRVISAIEHRFFSQPISARPREALLAAIPNNSHLDNVQLRAAVRLALCAPEYQLA
jgi:uncharacterized protein (DUF1800 family)